MYYLRICDFSHTVNESPNLIYISLDPCLDKPLISVDIEIGLPNISSDILSTTQISCTFLMATLPSKKPRKKAEKPKENKVREYQFLVEL
jgi:hypothetical protein